MKALSVKHQAVLAALSEGWLTLQELRTLLPSLSVAEIRGSLRVLIARRIIRIEPLYELTSRGKSRRLPTQ